MVLWERKKTTWNARTPYWGGELDFPGVAGRPQPAKQGPWGPLRPTGTRAPVSEKVAVGFWSGLGGRINRSGIEFCNLYEWPGPTWDCLGPTPPIHLFQPPSGAVIAKSGIRLGAKGGIVIRETPNPGSAQRENFSLAERRCCSKALTVKTTRSGATRQRAWDYQLTSWARSTPPRGPRYRDEPHLTTVYNGRG